jgi:hypothetical protein
MPERLTPVELQVKEVVVPEDKRFDFLRGRIGFQDLQEWENLTIVGVKEYMPRSCPLKNDPDFKRIEMLM